MPEGVDQRGAGGGDAGGQDHQSVVAWWLRQFELPGRAQHPVGLLSTHLALGDLETARQDGPDRSQGHEVADGEVPRPADDLQRAAVARVYINQADLVGVGVGPDGQDPGHHHVSEARADALDPFHHQTELGKGGGQLGDVGFERRVVA
jgi:hypothetical protein